MKTAEDQIKSLRDSHTKKIEQKFGPKTTKAAMIIAGIVGAVILLSYLRFADFTEETETVTVGRTRNGQAGSGTDIRYNPAPYQHKTMDRPVTAPVGTWNNVKLERCPNGSKPTLEKANMYPDEDGNEAKAKQVFIYTDELPAPLRNPDNPLTLEGFLKLDVSGRKAGEFWTSSKDGKEHFFHIYPVCN